MKIELEFKNHRIKIYKFNSESGEIPLSIYLLKNKINNQQLETNIISIHKRNKYNNNTYYYLDYKLSIPLGFFSQLLKLQYFINKNNLKLDYKTITNKKQDLLFKYNHNSKKQNLPKEYKLEDNYCVDTYILKEGIKINKSSSRHPDADKTKLIIANKSSLNGIFIEDGRLGICGLRNYYILGNIKYINFIKKITTFKLIIIGSLFSKYNQHFLDTDIFLYIPDLSKLGYKDITEENFYKLIGLSENEIKEITDYKY